jgi:His-Xaa-Ser system protein HxsD
MTAEEQPRPEFLCETEEGVAFRVDPGLYGERSILEAVHRFTGRCFVHVDRESDGRLLCRVVPRAKGANARELAGALANEILDQSLRQRLQEETEPIRRLLLAQAFSRTNILHPELDEADPQSDPLGIVAPDPPFRPE